LNAKNQQADEAANWKDKPRKCLAFLVGVVGGYYARQNTEKELHQKNEAEGVRWAMWTAKGTWTAAVVAAGAAGLLIWQIIATREASFLENRAWLAPINARPLEVKKPSGLILYGISLPNMGKSPAINLNWKADSYLIQNPSSRDYRTAKFHGGNPCDGLAPDDKGGEASYPTQADQPPPTKTELTKSGITWGGDIESGKQIVVVRGCVAYETIGRSGFSAYCFIFDKLKFSPDLTNVTWLTVPCPSGNFAY
jgi:hypothetical protein